MQESQDTQRSKVAPSLDQVSGEQLDGSGFENEEPEPGFINTDLAQKE